MCVLFFLITTSDIFQENAQSYKEKYDALNTMIAPFREQLESYEMERNYLLAQKKEAQGQVQKLADQYAQLMGHQNHKQKIHHLGMYYFFIAKMIIASCIIWSQAEILS